jgi:2-C-methyl-D-erythritol 4-phosphate cytidylyltransferase
MYVTAVVLAAGKGMRLKSKVSKPLIKVGLKPLIFYCLDTLNRHAYVKDIIVVANRQNFGSLRKAIKSYHIDKVKDVVLGGSLRQGSVAQGLKAIDQRTEIVLIHDGARPFIDSKTVSSSIKAAAKYGAAIVGVPVKATVKSARPNSYIVDETLDRGRLWEIQTPQVFKKDLILKAFDKFGGRGVTDDAMLVEMLGAKVNIVPGSYKNIKVTTPEDLIFAQAIAKRL